MSAYTCPHCGQQHEDWPALAYASPTYYHELSEEEKGSIAQISSDLCTIHHPEQTDRFIRCTLTLKVTDHCDDLDYGLWVSVSEKSFQDYVDHYRNDAHEARYFGRISNELPDYEQATCVPATIITRTGGHRPEIVPHSDFDHPLVRDYYEGISRAEAERRIKTMFESL